MNLRLLTTPLVAATLLLSTLGCAKAEEAEPAPNTGSYLLDSTLLSGQANISLDAGSIGGTTYDFLALSLLPTSQSAEGVTKLSLLFYKAPGSPAATYSLHNLSVYPKGSPGPYNFASTGFTLTAASDGSFSGTFSGRVNAASSMIRGPYTTITNGVFTAVRP